MRVYWILGPIVLIAGLLLIRTAHDAQRPPACRDSNSTAAETQSPATGAVVMMAL
jgi:hypothetical protein